MLITRTIALIPCLAVSLILAGCAEETAPQATTPDPEVNEEETSPPDSESSENEEETTDEEETAESNVPEIAPEDVKLEPANWEEVRAEVAEHKGKVVVLDIWSTSCQPCLREFPNLVDLSRKYPEQVVCLSLNTDYYGSTSKPPEYYEERVRKILSGMNAAFDNYLCTIPSDELFEKIDLASIPAVYVFGPDGEVAEFFNNDEQKYGDEFTYEEHIIPKIESLLNPAE